jgi:hypothetical protein
VIEAIPVWERLDTQALSLVLLRKRVMDLERVVAVVTHNHPDVLAVDEGDAHA